MVITAQQVKELREKTDAGMMECKAALQEANGDFEQAVTILRKKGLAAAAKRAGRIASEGIVLSYIHPGDKLAVLVELNCETDFVAKTEDFRKLAKDIAMHIAAMNPQYVRKEEVPAEVVEKEKEIYRAKVPAGKPANVVEKIIEGQLTKFYSEVCVYEQPFVKNDKLTVEQHISEKSLKTKEKVSLRRFVRFKVGEGMEKRSTDLAAEVAAQLGQNS
jgi:elongation factor Ts